MKKKLVSVKLVKEIVSFFKKLSWRNMNKIFFKPLPNGNNLYNLKKATMGSAGFDLVAAISEKISLNQMGKLLFLVDFHLNYLIILKPK